jgi:hypothetical protein
MGKRPPLFPILAVILIGAVAIFLALNRDVLVEKIAETPVKDERQAWMQRTQELEDIILQMQKGREARPLLPAERLSQVFGPASPLVRGASPKSMECRQLEEALRTFCRYLDATEILRSQKTHRDSWALLTNMLATLEKKLPTISGETYHPSAIIENSFYFYRLLRKERINIVRDVLQYEADLAEPLTGILYYWLLSGRQCDKLPSSESTLETMYNYAVFFLNTLGGHSYLYRRGSKIRLLTIYYATLVIHEANLRGLNEVGLDLRFFLPLIFDEVHSRNDLSYAEEYLETLSNLQLHYFRQE